MPLTPVSMAITPQEKKEKAARMADGPRPEEMEDFPWGLQITLRHEDLQKLGFASGGLESGAVVGIVGTASVSRVESEIINNISERTVSLQIKTLGMEEAAEETDRASVLFGES